MKLAWHVKLVVFAIVIVVVFLLFRKEKYSITDSNKSDLMKIMNKYEMPLDDQEKLLELLGKWDLNKSQIDQTELSQSEIILLYNIFKSYPDASISIRDYFTSQ